MKLFRRFRLPSLFVPPRYRFTERRGRWEGRGSREAEPGGALEAAAEESRDFGLDGATRDG